MDCFDEVCASEIRDFHLNEQCLSVAGQGREREEKPIIITRQSIFCYRGKTNHKNLQVPWDQAHMPWCVSYKIINEEGNGSIMPEDSRWRIP